MTLSNAAWWTRKARMQAEKRLLSNAAHSQILLLWYSFASVAASIFYLNFATRPTDQNIAGITWVVFSVLVLCISGFINGLSFKERAARIKEGYEMLKTFYHKANQDGVDLSQLSSEYEQILGLCENHTDRDYYWALCIEHMSRPGNANKDTGLKKGLDRCPTIYHWAFMTHWFFARFLLLTPLYLLPIFLFFAMEYVA